LRERHPNCYTNGMAVAVTTGNAKVGEAVADFSVVDLSVMGSSIVDSLMIGAACQPARLAMRHAILLVEDETFVRQAMAAALRSSGYAVLTAANGSQALGICRECAQPPDLLLSDMVMPGMSGAYLATLFEAMYPWSQVLLMSGYVEELSPRQTQRYRATQLRKPFSIVTLINVVREILDTDTPTLTARARKA
jgi:DNA-binding NtrC family response regulator